MFVLEAILLTFLTTPAVSVYYPPEIRVRASDVGANWAPSPPEGDNREGGSPTGEGGAQGKADEEKKTRFTVVLDKIEHLPGMLSLAQLIIPPPPPYGESDPRLTSATTINEKSPTPDLPTPTIVSLDAIRLIELSDRTSAVMKGSNIEALTATDPLLDIYTTFGALQGVPVTSSLSIVPFEDLGATVAERATRTDSQLVVVPWLPPHHSIGTVHDQHINVPGVEQPSGGFGGLSGGAMLTPRLGNIQNPFEALFRATSAGAEERDVSLSHSQFVRGLFAAAKTDVALFVDRHTPGGDGGSAGLARSGVHRLFVPFFGGPDDRLALDFAVQLCANPRISATVVRIAKCEDAELVQEDSGRSMDKQAESGLAVPDHPQNHATIATVSIVPCLRITPLLTLTSTPGFPRHGLR